MMNNNTFRAYINWTKKANSRTYPNRKLSYREFEEYIFFEKTCTVYLKAMRVFMDLAPEIYDDMKRFEDNERKYYERRKEDTDPIDKPINGDPEDRSLADYIPSNDFYPEEELLDAESRKQIHDAVDSLSPRRKKIIEDLYYNDKTEMEVADELGISQSAVNQQKAKALIDLEMDLADEFEFE